RKFGALARYGRVRAMTISVDKASAARAFGLAQRDLSRPGAPASLPERLLVIDVGRQLATLLEKDTAGAARPLPTPRNRSRSAAALAAGRAHTARRLAGTESTAASARTRLPERCSCRASRPARHGAERQAMKT